ncbi:MAG: MotB family protein [Rhizobiaceae bacterium]|nr:MAG: MotB family protein [Rhizobiaceae bacterium]
MNVGADGEPRQEIIIVRRGSHDDDDAHHGGVWKIAFADFMTAMMCFFLVMWLINAANEQTRVALASYFNPVKLIDRNTSRKGLDNPDMTDPLASSKNGSENNDSKPTGGDKPGMPGVKDKQPAADTGSEKHASNDKLFSDPYAVLSEIAGETGVKQNISSKGDGGAQDAGPATGASGGKAYRDPFAPDFWSEQVDRPKDAIETTLPAPAGKTGASAPSKSAEAKAESKPAPAPEQKVVARLAPAEAKPAEPAESAAAVSAKMAGEAHAIREELARKFGKSDKVYQGLSVVATDKGIAISVTDQLNYGMFEIGSAVPRKELVLAMEKIARTLEAHKGLVRINGYTDARPFKGGTYDNWQLSAARAEAAYYMLVRAGFDEKRVLSITGYADRKLKVKDDPFADANRRIEILLEPAG